MAHKVIVLTDSGIDGAFALALALADPLLEVLGVLASAGSVEADQATQNVFTLVELLDPPRRPRVGAALPIVYDAHLKALHGNDGLGDSGLPRVGLHSPMPADRLFCELVRQHPEQVTLVILGPATVVARAIDRDPELPRLLEQIVFVGGTWREPGDIAALSEFHFWCDPAAARQVLFCGAPITLIPLDVSNRLVYSPADLRTLPEESTPTGSLLRTLLPLALAPTAGLRGTEGVHLNDAVGLVAVCRPELFTLRAVPAEVELRGDWTRGTCVIDTRWACPQRPNVELVVEMDLPAVRDHIQRTLQAATRRE
ncbi:MAG: nucleoside hydrolase [Gemmataceae bacterium]